LIKTFKAAEDFMKKVVRVAQPRGSVVRIACINKAKTPLGVPLSMLTAALQRFAKENRRGHCSEFRKPRGLHTKPPAKKKVR
jgi:hypothetical protein